MDDFKPSCCRLVISLTYRVKISLFRRTYLGFRRLNDWRACTRSEKEVDCLLFSRKGGLCYFARVGADGCNDWDIRYSRGEAPIHLLKARVKLLQSENPTMYATSSTDMSRSER